MRPSYLTKEEVKAIKKGYAYRRWSRRNHWVMLIALAWMFGGIPLAQMNDITQVIYFIGLVLVLIAEFWAFISTCWTCPKCKTKLPSKTAVGGTANASLPMLVKTCPHCGLDLTKKKDEIEVGRNIKSNKTIVKEEWH